MSLLRFEAVREASGRKAVGVETPAERPEKYYGELVFNRQKMFESTTSNPSPSSSPTAWQPG